MDSRSVVRFVYENWDGSTTAWVEDNLSGNCCLHDTEPFTGKVYSYPVRRELGVWYMKGQFCSLSCAKRYILERYPVGSNILNLFSLMCRLVYGQSSELQAAPAQCLLNKFSGKLSLDEFRSDCVRFVKSPLFPFASCVHEYGEKPIPMETAVVTQADLVRTEPAVFQPSLSGLLTTTTLDSFLELDKECPEDLDEFEMEEDEDDLHGMEEG